MAKTNGIGRKYTEARISKRRATRDAKSRSSVDCEHLGRSKRSAANGRLTDSQILEGSEEFVYQVLNSSPTRSIAATSFGTGVPNRSSFRSRTAAPTR